MKFKWIGSVLVAGALAFSALEQSASAAPSPAAPGADKKTSTCLNACLQTYLSNVERCRRSSWVCTYSLFGICLEGHHDEERLRYCVNLAQAVHDACVDEC